MGWTFSNRPETREQALERIAPAAGWKSDGNDVSFSREKWTAEGCWGLLTVTAPNGMILQRLVAFARVARHGGLGYGEGGLWPETVGPCEQGCPAHLLKTEPVYDENGPRHATEWRRRLSSLAC